MRKNIILLFILVFISPVSAFTDKLVLEKGKGVEVCEAYIEHIKNLSLQEMVCGEKTETETIKRPKWERLELKENKELFKKIQKFLSDGDQFAEMKIMDDEKQFEELMDNMYTRSDALYKATVNIDNDSKAEKVLRYSEGLCMESHVYARPLLILDADKNLINPVQTEPLLQNPFGKDIKSKAQNHFYQLYDIFSFKNTTYFDKWNMRDWTLSVYNLSKSKVREVCKYKYEQTLINKEESHEN